MFFSKFYKKIAIFRGPSVRASRTSRGPRTTVWETQPDVEEYEVRTLSKVNSEDDILNHGLWASVYWIARNHDTPVSSTESNKDVS